MIKRIKIDQLLASPSTGGVYRAHRAYTTSPTARFAATQQDGSKTWTITHRKSGGAISSLVPRLTISLVEALAIVAALDALETDWSAFDDLDETRNGGAPAKGFSKAPSRDTVDAIRAAIRGAL